MATTSTNQIIGIVLIVLGVLLLANWLHIPYLSEIIGVILVIVGIMAMIGAGRVPKNVVLGVILVVLGILVLVPQLQLGGAIAGVITTVIGVLLIVGGILKLLGKW